MADKTFNESGIGDFNKDLEANIKMLERLSKAADKASGSVDGLSDTYNKLAQLAEGKLQFKVSGLRSLKFLIDIDDAKFSKLTRNLEQLDNISKNFDIQFNVSGIKDINRLQNINIEKIKESMKSLEEVARDFQTIDISNTINVSDDLVKGLSRLERLSRFDVNNLSNALKGIKEASKDFEDINIDAVINVSDDLVKGLSRLERLSRFDVSKLNNTIKELQDVAREPINIDMNININEGELAKLKELNELLKNYKLINKINNTSGGGNTGSSTSNKNKSKNDLFFTLTRLSDTATSAARPLSSLAGNITKLGLANGGTIAAIALLAKITVEAQKNTSNYARSLMVMNKELSELDKRSIETTNKLNILNNRMSNLMQGLGDLLSPFLDLIVDLAEAATSFLPDDERKDIKAKYLDNVSGSVHQSGMTKNTSNVLASNTYNVALGLTNKFGEKASVIADKLAKAWMTGSDAAKDYGVVLNDNVLTGYLWSKGIDIANVEITDAMKQYYRYQLMVDQTSGKVTDSMIKDWTSLGFIIDKTKGKLFSFDEVIQLVAADPTIPEVTGSAYLNDESNNTDKKIPPVVTPWGTNTYGPNPDSLPVFEPVTVPVLFDVPDYIPIPSFEPVNIPVIIPVTIPGFDSIPGLQGALERLPGIVPVEIPVTIPGFNSIPWLLNYFNLLSNTAWLATLNIMIPGLNLAPVALTYLETIAKDWIATVDIKTVGLSVLERVEALLAKVAAWLQALGQNIKAGVTSTISTVRNDATNKVNSIKNNVVSFGTGLAGATGTGLIGAWAPTSANAYGGGFKGALLADLDLNAARSRLKSSTAEGYTTEQLRNATSSYIGYNLNPANKNSGSRYMLEGAVASALVAGGIATLPEAAGALASAGSNGLAALAEFISGLGQLTPALVPAFAEGGIGTREIHNATLFEGNKKEAVIPLETSEGIDYLADAMSRAGAGNNTSSGDIVINLTLSGLNLANNDAEWERVGRKIGEIIDIQRQRRGELNYGSSF